MAVQKILKEFNMDIDELVDDICDRTKLPKSTVINFRITELVEVVKRLYGKQLQITLVDE